MSTEFSDEIGSILEYVKEDLVERLTVAVKEEARKQINIEEIIKRADVPYLIRQSMNEQFRQYVVNEIDNRLRCGIYNGTQVDRLFESVWTEGLDKAIKDRIRSRAYKAVDEVIVERLKKMKEA